MLEFLGAIAGILLVDFVLSGDNALVIGAAAAKLPRRQRWLAIFWGGAGAVVLRIAFAFIASFLLQLAWIQAIGGLIREHKQAPDVEEQDNSSGLKERVSVPDVSRAFFPALLTILVADVTMSLDNVLAVGALSHGNLLVLSIGIFISIVILLVGSALVAELIKWFPWLLDVAALVLAWTGASMILHDLRLGAILANYSWTAVAVPAVALGLVLIADVFLRLRDRSLANRSLIH
jgi:YjbE family integral membrane protein